LVLFLRRIGIHDDEVNNRVELIDLKPDADRNLSTSLMDSNLYSINYTSFKVRPHVIIYERGLDETFKDHWVSIELLIQAEDLYDQKTNKVNVNAQVEIKRLMLELQREFQESAIYFTDEAQEGIDFDGIRMNDSSLLWNFDAALIPHSMKEQYDNPPSQFCTLIEII
jgi:hypothetical protein